ncbi:MAG: ATP-binding cassette domain-containing protein [Campylobacterota bacterium]|nr:ATP-binding cassette domain-containing protein [Campylobacterota bacterium]
MASLYIDKLIIEHNNDSLVDLFKSEIKELDITSSLALVGQSGSGKSLSMKAILNMLPSNLTAHFNFSSDFNLTKKNIGFIPQNPFTSLSPMTKIYKQFFKTDLTLFEKKEIDKLLELVDLPSQIKYRFPSELSGGQLQRVVIAIALSNKPKLLLLDEPTTALDTDNKNIILKLLKKLQKEFEFLTIFISHDIDSVKDLCEYTAVMKDGILQEYGETSHIIKNPKNNYTKMLLLSDFKNREFRS